jgi:hypothetical protein
LELVGQLKQVQVKEQMDQIHLFQQLPQQVVVEVVRMVLQDLQEVLVEVLAHKVQVGEQEILRQ